jgi:hypothetical protein
MKINSKTFFNYYIVHPFSKELSTSEKTAAAVSSSVFLFLTLGTLHSRALKLEKKIQKKDQAPLTKALASEKLGTPPPSQKEVVVVMAPPLEKKFVDQLSSQQQSLYDSLRTTTEKKLYEALYQFEGAFADLVLHIVKGRVVDFKVNENQVVLNLNGGSTTCKLLGFDLNAQLPHQLILQHFPKNRKVAFLEKIPFDYSGVYILTPETATFRNQGVLVHADLSWPAKLSGRATILEAPLSSAEVFKLFS